MKILKIIHGYPPQYSAGSEVYSQSICDELKKKHEIVIFTREENPYMPDFSMRKEDGNSLCTYFINMPRGKDGYRHVEVDLQFRQIICKERPDIAHIGHLNHLSTGIIDELKKQDIPIVFTLHDFWLMCPRGQFLQRNFDSNRLYELCNNQDDVDCARNCYNMYFSGKNDQKDLHIWSGWVMERMAETRQIVDKVDLFIAPSKYLMNRFVRDFNIPQDKIIYLDYGFPLHYLRPVSKEKKEQPYTFGYIGTHIPSKGINLMIEAFKKIPALSALRIWGSKDDQSTKALKQLAEGSINSVSFEGPYVNKNLASEVFNKVDCIVVPSIWGENSPLVIHEAQACKIPVITADYGGMAEYVSHGVNGLLFRHRNVNSLNQQMEWAINNPSKMTDFGNHGYLYDINGFVPEITVHCKKLEMIYEQICKKHEKSTLEINAGHQS